MCQWAALGGPPDLFVQRDVFAGEPGLCDKVPVQLGRARACAAIDILWNALGGTPCRLFTIL
jgi:hypothetical protein